MAKLKLLRLSALLAKMQMLAAVPSQKVVTQSGDRFQLLKLGLYPLRKKAEDDQIENVELVQIQGNHHYQRHCHKHSEAVIYIISGRGKLMLGSQVIDYQPNVRVVIPQNIMHGFITSEETLFLSIQNPHIIDPVTGDIDIHYE